MTAPAKQIISTTNPDALARFEALAQTDADRVMVAFLRSVTPMTAPTQTRVVIEAETFIVVQPDGRAARVLRLHFDNCPHCWEVGADRMLLSDMVGLTVDETCRECEAER